MDTNRFVKRASGLFAHIVSVLILSACGHHSSDPLPVASTPPPVTSVEVSTTSLDVGDQYLDPSPLSQSVDFVVKNVPADGVYVRAVHSNTAITASDATLVTAKGHVVTPSNGHVAIRFKLASELGLGNYSDTVTLSVCLDIKCTSQATGSPVTTAVNFTVRKPTQAESPVLSASPDSIDRSIFITDTSTPGAYITLGVSAYLPTLPTISVTSTQVGMQPAIFASYGGAGSINLTFKQPTDIGPGTFNDTITVTACIDALCTMPFANSPLIIHVAQIVSNQLGGSNGLTYTITPNVTANDIAYNPTDGLLYVSVPSASATNGNSVTKIDPATASIVGSAFVGSEPGPIGLSNDGQFVYVGLKGASNIVRLNASSLTADISIPLGNSGFYGPFTAGAISVMPGSAHTIAVNRIATSYGSHDVVIFDNAVQRSAVQSVFSNVTSLPVWDISRSMLYTDSGDSFSGIYSLQVNASGLQLISSIIGGGTGMTLDSGLLYLGSGRVVDPAANSLVGTFTASGGNLIGSVPDRASNRFFALISSAGNVEIRSYSLSTYLSVASVIIPNMSFYTPTRLIRWGTDGLVLLSPSGQVLLLRGPFVTL